MSLNQKKLMAASQMLHKVSDDGNTPDMEGVGVDPNPDPGHGDRMPNFQDMIKDPENRGLAAPLLDVRPPNAGRDTNAYSPDYNNQIQQIMKGALYGKKA
jgi:hypothetical protein